MPRQSPFVIELDPEERQSLERRARQYTLPYRDVIRAKIILLAAEGWENKAIGETLQLPRPKVSKWRKRFFEQRLAGLEDRPRGGRPSVFPPKRRLKSRLWLVSCRPRWACPCRGSAAVSCAAMSSHKASSPRSLARPFGGGFPRMRFALGVTAVGSSHGILTSLPRPAAVLDLYHGLWQGKPLERRDFVISADEKAGLQIRKRRHPIRALRPGQPMLVEHEYRRRGTCAYQAAWDVQRARLFGHVVARSTIDAFDTLVADVMSAEPYRSAQRVFWIVDNGTVHRGQRAVERLGHQWPHLILVHLPVHASWLNQIEIYFSILQRKALTPDDFDSQDAISHRILDFQDHYQQIAQALPMELHPR